MSSNQKLELQMVGILARAKESGKNVAEAIGTTDGSLSSTKSQKRLHCMDLWKAAKMAELAGMKLVFVEK